MRNMRKLLFLMLFLSPYLWAGAYPTRMPEPSKPLSKVERFAHAVAKAEGFGRKRTIPSRYHNPGDLKAVAVRFRYESRSWI